MRRLFFLLLLLFAGPALAPDGRPDAVGAAVLAGFVMKLALEQAWRAPVQVLADGAVPVAVAAHAAGACAGLACAAGALLIRRATMRSARPRRGARPHRS